MRTLEQEKIAVIGLGYVGLPVALSFGRKLSTVGFDIRQRRIDELKKGHDETMEVTTEQLHSAEKLELTDNAIRAQLLALERDGLIRQSGRQRGHRKPHFAYELTSEAESLFPKAYDLLLNRVIAVLKARLTTRELLKVLREAGDAAVAEANVIGDEHGSAAYKRDLLRVFLARAIRAALADQ